MINMDKQEEYDNFMLQVYKDFGYEEGYITANELEYRLNNLKEFKKKLLSQLIILDVI